MPQVTTQSLELEKSKQPLRKNQANVDLMQQYSFGFKREIPPTSHLPEKFFFLNSLVFHNCMMRRLDQEAQALRILLFFSCLLFNSLVSTYFSSTEEFCAQKFHTLKLSNRLHFVTGYWDISNDSMVGVKHTRDYFERRMPDVARILGGLNLRVTFFAEDQDFCHKFSRLYSNASQIPREGDRGRVHCKYLSFDQLPYANVTNSIGLRCWTKHGKTSLADGMLRKLNRIWLSKVELLRRTATRRSDEVFMWLDVGLSIKFLTQVITSARNETVHWPAGSIAVPQQSSAIPLRKLLKAPARELLPTGLFSDPKCNGEIVNAGVIVGTSTDLNQVLPVYNSFLNLKMAAIHNNIVPCDCFDEETVFSEIITSSPLGSIIYPQPIMYPHSITEKTCKNW